MLQHHIWKGIHVNTAVDNLFNYKPKSYFYSSPLTTGISYSIGLSGTKGFSVFFFIFVVGRIRGGGFFPLSVFYHCIACKMMVDNESATCCLPDTVKVSI